MALGALVGFTVGAMLTALLLPLFLAGAPAPALPALPAAGSPAEGPGLWFDCTATSVWDGDGPVACVEGFKVRLSGVAAREIDGACRPGHPCPAASGIASRDALVAILGGARGTLPTGHIVIAPIKLRCLFAGGTYDRIAAWCSTPAVAGRPAVDVSCAMIASGTALKWDRFWDKHRCRA